MNEGIRKLTATVDATTLWLVTFGHRVESRTLDPGEVMDRLTEAGIDASLSWALDDPTVTIPTAEQPVTLTRRRHRDGGSWYDTPWEVCYRGQSVTMSVGWVGGIRMLAAWEATRPRWPEDAR